MPNNTKLEAEEFWVSKCQVTIFGRELKNAIPAHAKNKSTGNGLAFWFGQFALLCPIDKNQNNNAPIFIPPKNDLLLIAKLMLVPKE